MLVLLLCPLLPKLAHSSLAAAALSVGLSHAWDAEFQEREPQVLTCSPAP